MEDRSNKSWSAEEDEALTFLRQNNLSFGVCAERLKKKFPHRSFTRSSCIGRAGRLKLKKQGRSGFEDVNLQRKMRTKKPKLSAIKRTKKLQKAMQKAVEPKTVKTPAPPKRTLVETRHIVSFHELKDHHCRYIVSDDGQEYQYCGVRVNERSSYCEYHYGVCFDHAPVKRKIKTGG